MKQRLPRKTPRTAHPLPDAHDHKCPHCDHTCVYLMEQTVHKCPHCFHIHSISTQDAAKAYIHSPGGADDVQPMDEETLACIIVAECHAYAWRNQVSFGCWSLKDNKPIYSRKDAFGHTTLLFNFQNRVPYEMAVDYDEWEDLFLVAWRDGGKDNNQLMPINNDRSRKGDAAA